MQHRSWIGIASAAAFGVLLPLVSLRVSAAPLAELSRTQVTFGRVAPMAQSHVQPVFVTNTGDAPLNISGISVTGNDAASFAVAGTCNAPMVLAPGARCHIDITMDAQLGAHHAIDVYLVAASVTLQSDSSPPPATIGVQGTVDIYDGNGFLTTPDWIDFVPQPVGTSSSSQMLTIKDDSSESEARSIMNVGLSGGDASDFSINSACVVGSDFSTGETCSWTIQFTPTAIGPRSTELLIDLRFTGFPPNDDAPWVDRFSITGVGSPAGSIMPTSTVEFYDAGQDHYFMTWIPNEIAILDAGVQIKGWTRTGFSFNTYPMPTAGTSPVCRFYIPPGLGDSHFYGRGSAECDATAQKNPTFVLEDPDFMNMFLPAAGVCPTGTTEVYRVFDNRPDANHRYMTDRTVRDQMVAKGWVAEGDGPDFVVMCAP